TSHRARPASGALLPAGPVAATSGSNSAALGAARTSHAAGGRRQEPAESRLRPLSRPCAASLHLRLVGAAVRLLPGITPLRNNVLHCCALYRVPWKVPVILLRPGLLCHTPRLALPPDVPVPALSPEPARRPAPAGAA